MRYGIQPQTTAERLALWLGLAPVPVIDMLIPLIKVRAIMAAVRLGVFAQLARQPSSALEVAAARSLDAEGTRLLLRVLHGSGYVALRGQRYRLTRASTSLVPGAPHGLSAYVEFNHAQWGWIEELESTLQHGSGVDLHRRLPAGSDAWVGYQRAMLDLARPVAPFLAKHVPVARGARRLLDLGGGHGLLGALICRAHPPLRSTVIELGSAIPEARRLAISEGIADVVEHQPGDVTSCELGRDLDVVLIANVLHHLSEAERERLVRRVDGSLRAGGTLAIWETEAHDDGAPELARDALSLYFRVTSAAPPLIPSELVETLARAGFEETRLERTRRLPGRVLIHARKPARRQPAVR